MNNSMNKKIKKGEGVPAIGIAVGLSAPSPHSLRSFRAIRFNT